jgi:hypothetical protein
MAGFVGDCILLAVEDATFLGVGYWVQAEMLAKTKRLQLPQIAIHNVYFFLFRAGNRDCWKDAGGIDRVIALIKNTLDRILIEGTIASGIIFQ